MRITFTDDTFLRAINFAIEYFAKERKQSAKFGDDNEERRIINCMAGKLGEEAIADYLETDTRPDYAIYPRGTVMSHEPDLRKGAHRIHVKTCIAPECSWLADPNTDPMVTNPDPNDLVALTCWHPATQEIEIFGLISASELSRQWLEPKSPVIRRRGKKALYWDQQGGFNPPIALQDHPELHRLSR